MPFEPGHNLSKDTKFSSDNQPEHNGRPLGVKNRSTIARKVLEMTALLPDVVFEKVKEVFPEIEKQMTAEEVMTIVMIGNAISKGDVHAYKNVMDSAYGAPKQEIDNNLSGSIETVRKIGYGEKDKS